MCSWTVDFGGEICRGILMWNSQKSEERAELDVR